MKGKDQRGGGAVIPCTYKLLCYDNTYDKVTEYMVNGLKELQFQGTEEVEIQCKKEEAASCPW